MPPKKALELMLTGHRVGADEADKLGFVTSVVPVDDINAGAANSSPWGFTPFNDELYFQAYTVAQGSELWKVASLLLIAFAQVKCVVKARFDLNCRTARSCSP